MTEYWAPAKINLHLDVVGRRPDGYHLLETLMVKLELADRLIIEPGSGSLEVVTDDPGLPGGPSNLVHRAGASFFQLSGLFPDVRIRLEKNIPVAAGLGGGSSDAALTLLGLNEMYRRPLDRETLFQAGLRLGADIPFFLGEWDCAWASGIGEVLSPGPELERFPVLLVNPGWPLSTAWVYKNFKYELTIRPHDHIFSPSHERSFTIDRPLYNDLEEVVLTHYPEVARIKELLVANGARAALMSGSGPTVFGIFPDRDVLNMAGRELTNHGPDRWFQLKTWTKTGA